MKRFLLFLFCISVFVYSEAQSATKSSGVVKLNISKKKEIQETNRQDAKSGQAVSSVSFTPVKQEKNGTETSPDQKPSQEVISRNEIKFFAPSVNHITTSKDEFLIKALVSSNEDVRVVNIFNNTEFQKNVIVNSAIRNKVGVEETISLHLGFNEIKLEAVTASGLKIEETVYVNYDLSSARYYALIIAVEDYNDPHIVDLDKPIKDASDFNRIITARYTFNDEDITFLKNPTKAEIIGTLHNMRSFIREEDNLLIFYAGHGYYDEEMETGYWLPSDAEKDNPVNWLPNTDITNYLSVLNTKHTLLIADACFSGGIFKSRAAFNTDETIERLYSLPSRKAMTSGLENQEVPDESQFVKYLKKKLLVNTRKYWTSEELFHSIKTPVMQNSDNIPKYGTIQKVGDEGGDFVFILKK